MANPENQFTVFIRLPFKRGDFVDPPPVAWSAAKERELWDVISRQSKSNEIDWSSLANQFQVTQQFLLQQAAWLYERQLSQVRAQMRRMGNRQSATASPVPGSTAASMVGTQASKRPAAITSRGPSRLSTQISASATPIDASGPSTPARSKTSLPLKSTVPSATSGGIRAQPPSSQPLSRRPSKDNDFSSRTHSRRGSIQQSLAKSPIDISSSSEDETVAKPTHRRPNPATTQRRTSSTKKSQHARTSSMGIQQLREHRENEEEGEDDPAFLPFAGKLSKTEQDPSATLRGIPTQPVTSTRPILQRNHTSERVRPASTAMASASNTAKQPHSQTSHRQQLASSTSSLSSANSPILPTTIPPRLSSAPAGTASTSTTTRTSNTPQPLSNRPVTLPTPLSPHQQAALATAAGLSPRPRAVPQHTHTGSESSPSMGSSFSDLDDASVTQSALEEALMSNMNALGSTAGVGGGGLGSRVSGISQALRSRYFDARSATGSGTGNGGVEGQR